MNPAEIVVDGTLKADGTLELHGRPDLPPGPVRVTLHREAPAAPPKESWWECMQRLRREREAANGTFLNDEEVEELIRELRDEEGIDERLYRAEPSQ